MLVNNYSTLRTITKVVSTVINIFVDRNSVKKYTEIHPCAQLFCLFKLLCIKRRNWCPQEDPQRRRHRFESRHQCLGQTVRSAMEANIKVLYKR